MGWTKYFLSLSLPAKNATPPLLVLELVRLVRTTLISHGGYEKKSTMNCTRAWLKYLNIYHFFTHSQHFSPNSVFEIIVDRTDKVATIGFFTFGGKKPLKAGETADYEQSRDFLKKKLHIDFLQNLNVDIEDVTKGNDLSPVLFCHDLYKFRGLNSCYLFQNWIFVRVRHIIDKVKKADLVFHYLHSTVPLYVCLYKLKVNLVEFENNLRDIYIINIFYNFCNTI